MMINEMKNSRSSDLLPMFYDCNFFLINGMNSVKSKEERNGEADPTRGQTSRAKEMGRVRKRGDDRNGMHKE